MNATIRTLCAAACCAVLTACASSDEISLPAPPAAGEPSDLIGLTAGNLRGTFGMPAFVRKDGSDEMWRYDGASCKAFFFLYPDGDGLAVHHVETLPRGQARAADASCLNALRAHGAPPVS